MSDGKKELAEVLAALGYPHEGQTTMDESRFTMQTIRTHPIMVRQDIYREIEQERAAQDAEWGGPDHDDALSGEEWLKKTQEHLLRIGTMEAFKGAPPFRRQMLRVAALAVAAVEWFDRREGR